MRRVVARRKGMSILRRSCFKVIFFPITAAIPRTRKILVIFDPSTFPTTISVAPPATAANEDPSSGRLVPIPTIKTPVINGDRPAFNPIDSAAPTKKSEDFISRDKLKINMTIHKKIDIINFYNIIFGELLQYIEG